MDDAFKIYVDRLRDGHTEKINLTCSPDFIDIDDDELDFNQDVRIEGQAYLADDHVVIHLKISTYATIPCSICNGPVDVEIDLPNFYHMEPTAEIKSGLFDFSEVLREAILLEVPPFGECHNGKCPEREKIAKYIKVKSADGAASAGDDEGYQPFADIDLEKYKPTK